MADPTPQPSSGMDPMTLIIIVVAVLFLSGKITLPTNNTTPSTGIVASPATIAACAPIKQAVASTDIAKRQRLSSAFTALAVTLAAAGDDVKTTGRLSDLIQKFSDVVSTTEPDLRGVLPATASAAFTSARDATFAFIPGTGADKPINKSQGADFAAGIAASLK